MSLRFAHETYRLLGQVAQNLDEHEKIYQAMFDGQVEAAGLAMKDHLAHSRENMEQTMGA